MQQVAVLGGARCDQRHVRLMAVLSDEVCVGLAILEDETCLSAVALVAHHAVGSEDWLHLSAEAERRGRGRGGTAGLGQDRHRVAQDGCGKRNHCRSHRNWSNARTAAAVAGGAVLFDCGWAAMMKHFTSVKFNSNRRKLAVQS